MNLICILSNYDKSMCRYTIKQFKQKMVPCLVILLTHFFAFGQDEQSVATPSQFIIITLYGSDAVQLPAALKSNTATFESSGIQPMGIAIDIDTPDISILGCAVTDMEKAMHYIKSESITKDMAKLNLGHIQQVKFLLPLDAVDDLSGNSLLVMLTHHVQDYHVWRSTFFASEAERLKAGMNYIGVAQTIGDSNEVSVIFSCSDKKRAKAFIDYSYRTNALKDAGVIGPLSSRFIAIVDDESQENLNSGINNLPEFKKGLVLDVTSNVDCKYYINGNGSGTVGKGIVRRENLKAGLYSFLFINSKNPNDSIRINYNSDGLNREDVLFADLQHLIHKRVVKESSPLRSTTNRTTETIVQNMLLVTGGKFVMGDNNLNVEMREHEVYVKDFYFSRFELTQKQWTDIMGSNPSHFSNCDYCPVENVSYNDALEFIQKLNESTKLNFRLPTEAEWEFAAKGGRYNKHSRYSGGESLIEVAWCGENADAETHPVGQKTPNELGLYDMTGNVFEWCSDWYSHSYYQEGESRNPNGPITGTMKVLRGGSWSHGEMESLPVYRNKDIPTNRGRRSGFRLALDK